jgi:GalNAc-alpha-(1->4)-GalNAc-alpha-(1->3)-diNAcBac-PP-undecaprenol alpha-1,4-N-acetyl-D-galactosaminyltransferase
MKIVFIIATMGPGGAERVAATLSNAWVRSGHSVHFLTFDRPEATPYYPLDAAISVTGVDLAWASTGFFGAVAANVRRIAVLRRSIREAGPDAVVSFMLETNVLTLLAGVGQPWPLAIAERIHPAFHPAGRIWRFLRRCLYARADKTVAQTRDIAAWLQSETGADVQVIPNPIDRALFADVPTTKMSERKTLLAVGRLERQKGHDITIAAFAQVAAALPNWDLVIIGDGPERAALQDRIEAAGLAGRVSLPGVTSDIAAAYRSADAVVHSARYEGYPNVIVEALTANKPVIAADAPGAMRELLDGGRYGALYPAESVEALAGLLSEILQSPEKLAAMADNARVATAALDVSKVAPVWIDMLSGLRRGRP